MVQLFLTLYSSCRCFHVSPLLLSSQSRNHKKSRANPLLSFISCSWVSGLPRSQCFHWTKLHPDSRLGVCSSVETRVDVAKPNLSAARYFPCSPSASYVQLTVSFGLCFYCWNPQEQTTTTKQKFQQNKKKTCNQDLKFFYYKFKEGKCWLNK